MPAFKSSEVERAISGKLGFALTNADHHMYELEIAGILIRTKVSHSKRTEYSGELLSMVARQLRVPRRDLEAIIRCHISREEYLELIRDTR
jgi:hypothetical protein